jgi:hypothetical protein
MNLTGKILKSFLYIWAAAILWIYIGSLVNFHQHKIWGRPLLPQLLYAKRDKEQSVDLNKLIIPGQSRDVKPGSFDHFIGIPVAYSNDYYNSPSSSEIAGTEETIPIERFLSSNGLRAPPLS